MGHFWPILKPSPSIRVDTTSARGSHGAPIEHVTSNREHCASPRGNPIGSRNTRFAARIEHSAPEAGPERARGPGLRPLGTRPFPQMHSLIAIGTGPI
jgi:hypothetical protein